MKAREVTHQPYNMPKLFTFLFALCICWSAGCTTTERTVRHENSAEDASGPVPLYEAALGDFSRNVTTTSEMAQAYMNQGFQMMYSFAASEAPATFTEAQKHDATCAMCFWGEAWSLGSYLNGPMRGSNAPAAYQAIQKAQALAKQSASDAEKALIQAMASRYEVQHDKDRRKTLDTLYSKAMGDVYQRFPHDLDAGTLYAESLMLLEPRRGRWNAEDPDVKAIHRVLEDVLKQDIHHPGACHLYIHATESTEKPEKAEACAEHLGNAIPGASHMNHMPSHTFNRVGRWGEAVRANIQAWHSDLKAEIDEGFAIYPSHNLHMLLFAASMDGQGGVAWQAAKDYAKIVDGGLFYEVLVLIRFGRFEEVLALEEAPSRPIFKGMWDFGKGYAHLRTGDVAKAQKYLDRVKKASTDIPEDQTFRGHKASELLGILGGILEAELLLQRGHTDAAIEIYNAAIELEDGLRYDEPEPLNFSARHWLGAALLDLGKPVEAVAVYEKALADHPKNGWCLLGLSQAYEALGKSEKAEQAYKDFEKAWARADTWIRESRF